MPYLENLGLLNVEQCLTTELTIPSIWKLETAYEEHPGNLPSKC